MNFSQRNGYIKPREVIQKDDLDYNTRIRILNFVSFVYSNKNLLKKFWTDFRSSSKELHPIILFNIDEAFKKFNLFFVDSGLDEVFSLIEFSFENAASSNLKIIKGTKEILPKKIIELNQILEEEKVAYRFINGIFIETESEAQIKQIEDLSNELKTANLSRSENHFNEAFRNLYDRNNPNYKTSIIESIRFLECLIAFKLNHDRGKRQLGDLLKDLKENFTNFKKSDFEFSVLEMFSEIYGKLSESIRHTPGEKAEKLGRLITPNFNQAKLIFNLANSLASYLLTLDLTKK